MRLRHLLVLAPLLAAAAEEQHQVDWVGDWEQAFSTAKETGRPVMVCINSKDGEKASEATAKDIYHDPEFVALSKSFVMVVVSTITHRNGGPCPRFGRVTCEEHLACWKALGSRYGEQFATAFAGEMISPQHAWFSPDGTLLRRKEYWTDKGELLERMRRVIEESKEKKKEEGPGEEGAPPKETPLSDADRADLARAEGPDGEARRAALGNLLSTEKPAARAAVIELLGRAGNPGVKCDCLRALGLALVVDARPVVEEHLEHKDPLVRSFAAVALERLARPESVAPLLKRARSERDPMARKNACRALGKCGGVAGDEQAAAALLKMVNGDKQQMIRKHAALALSGYTGAHASLVAGKLEHLALKIKDRVVRGGIVFTLAYVGSPETTAPVLQKLLEEAHDDYAKAFLREALRVVRKESSDLGRAAWFLFAEDRDDPARRDDLPSDGR